MDKDRYCKTCDPSGSIVSCKGYGIFWNSYQEKDLRDNICVDPCLAPILMYLWKNNIKTYGCCCGHNSYDATIIVELKQKDKLLELGYDKFKEISKEHTETGTFCLVVDI